MAEPHAGSCLNADRCAHWDPGTKQGAHTRDPLCDDCLDRAARDIRNLTYDYLDLAQLHEPSMSQAITEKASGSKDKPILISAHVEALQAEIVHVTTTWEYELRVTCRLPDPHGVVPVADWHTTITRPAPLPKVRPGAAVQRAINIIAPRVARLARIPATAVCPTGAEDTHAEMYGWEAVLHLTALHSRARAMLGRTTRRFWIPGECWTCDARPLRGVDGPLWRTEPQFADPGEEGRRDPMQVNCDKCGASRPYPDFETYMATLLWPTLEQAAA